MSTQPDITALHAHFNNAASSFFQEAYNTFRSEVIKLARNGDENVYQMLRSKHCHNFRQLLERHANTVIDQCGNRETQGRLRAEFTQRVHYFEMEFIRKADEY